MTEIERIIKEFKFSIVRKRIIGRLSAQELKEHQIWNNGYRECEKVHFDCFLELAQAIQSHIDKHYIPKDRLLGFDEIFKTLEGECLIRWKERGIWNVCGHPLPCPKHTDTNRWREFIAQAIHKAQQNKVK